MPITLTPKGVGKPDYSDDIFVQPIPIIRGPISVEPLVEKLTIGAGETKQIVKKWDTSRYIVYVKVSASKDIPLKVDMYYHETNILMWSDFGWGEIVIEWPTSRAISDLRVEITNLGEQEAEVIYNHLAVIGVEKLTPLYYRPPIPKI